MTSGEVDSPSLIYNSCCTVFWIWVWQQPCHVSLLLCCMREWRKRFIVFRDLIISLHPDRSGVLSSVCAVAGNCFLPFSRGLLPHKATWLSQHRLPHCNPQNIFNLFINLQVTPLLAPALCPCLPLSSSRAGLRAVWSEGRGESVKKWCLWQKINPH